MILALHPKTDALLDELTNKGDKLFWDDVRVQEVTGLHTFDFIMPADSRSAIHFGERGRFLTPSRTGGWHEFVIYETKENFVSNEKEVYGVAVHSELDKTKILPPRRYTAWTLRQYAELALLDTEWQVGTVEFNGIATAQIDDHLGSYSLLKKIQEAFVEPFEMRFRTEVSGNRITGRYIDFVEQVGATIPKEVEAGKDLLDMTRTINSDEIITALYVVGPERDDNRQRLSTMVTNEAAYQRWNRSGRHIMGYHEVESDDSLMTMEQLIGHGNKELNKRIASSITYEVTAAYLGHLFPHEDVTIGDRFRIKNTDFQPPLFAEARAIAVEESITDPSLNKYTVGEVREYSEADVMAAFMRLQKQYGARVIRQDTPPAGAANTIWVKTGDPLNFEIAHVWDAQTAQWTPITPQRASDIGAETPGGAQDKADQAEENAKDYTEDYVAGVKIEILDNFADFVEGIDGGGTISQQATAPASPKLDDLWIDTSSEPHVWMRYNGSNWVKASATSLEELSGKIKENQLEVGAVVAETLADDAVTASKVKAGAIVAGKLSTGAVTADNIAANSITTGMITTAGLDASVIKFGTMSGDRILANTIDANRLKAGSVIAEDIKFTGELEGATGTFSGSLSIGSYLSSQGRVLVSDGAVSQQNYLPLSYGSTLGKFMFARLSEGKLVLEHQDTTHDGNVVESSWESSVYQHRENLRIQTGTADTRYFEFNAHTSGVYADFSAIHSYIRIPNALVNHDLRISSTSGGTATSGGRLTAESTGLRLYGNSTSGYLELQSSNSSYVALRSNRSSIRIEESTTFTKEAILNGRIEFGAEPITSAVESGFCGLQTESSSTANSTGIGYAVAFRTTKSYTPSTVTIARASGSITNDKVYIGYITNEGFWFQFTRANLSGTNTAWRGRYTA